MKFLITQIKNIEIRKTWVVDKNQENPKLI
jgi:hypothetical protein